MSCADDKQNTQIKALDGQWARKDTLYFPIENKANTPIDILFVVRNNNDYPYSNIRFIASVKEENTDKTMTTDTLNYTLAAPDGRWLGTGFGDTKELEILYKEKYTFPKTGKYTLRLVQAMRTDTLRGLEDIGVKIEPKP